MTTKSHILHTAFPQDPSKTGHIRPKLFFRPIRQCDNKTSRMRFLTLVLALTLTGCGYHQAGSATHIPASVRTMAVPIFATNAQAYRTEMAFTQATIHELNLRTKYRIINNDTSDADATLHGTILSQTVTPFTYDSTTGQSSSYLVTITAKVVLTAHDGRVLYRNDTILYREQYQSTEDLSSFIQEDGYAVNRIAKDFAQTVVSDMLESF
jgi:outer membrane lipopolysaccharide assembly protein LptE/RlpB